jgi:hypothetical protein
MSLALRGRSREGWHEGERAERENQTPKSAGSGNLGHYENKPPAVKFLASGEALSPDPWILLPRRARRAHQLCDLAA